MLQQKIIREQNLENILLNQKIKKNAPIQKAKTPIKFKTPKVKSPVRFRAPKVKSPKVKSPIKVKAKTPIIVKAKTPIIVKAKTPIKVKTKTPIIVKAKTPIKVKSKTPIKVKSKTPIKIQTVVPIIEEQDIENNDLLSPESAPTYETNISPPPSYEGTPYVPQYAIEGPVSKYSPPPSYSDQPIAEPSLSVLPQELSNANDIEPYELEQTQSPVSKLDTNIDAKER